MPRADHGWRGLRSFRSWLLTIIDHCIRDAADHHGAQKRGGGRTPVQFSVLRGASSDTARDSVNAGPVQTTTPSRIAVLTEQVAAMQAALEELPEDVREVVRLRLFEQKTMSEIADRLGIGVAAVRHRFRRGAETYHRRLVAEFASRSVSIPADTAPPWPPSSAPMD